jgi:hypothetical protein
MGLDQFAHTRTTTPATPVDFESEDHAPELFYWRKHANLQGWMSQLYIKKGGTAPDFNCANLLITSGDLDALETATLPTAQGFFWGASDESDAIRDKEFIKRARQAIADGLFVVYSAWY